MTQKMLSRIGILLTLIALSALLLTACGTGKKNSDESWGVDKHAKTSSTLLAKLSQAGKQIHANFVPKVGWKAYPQEVTVTPPWKEIVSLTSSNEGDRKDYYQITINSLTDYSVDAVYGNLFDAPSNHNGVGMTYRVLNLLNTVRVDFLAQKGWVTKPRHLNGTPPFRDDVRLENESNHEDFVIYHFSVSKEGSVTYTV
jgi:hypothetical protein